MVHGLKTYGEPCNDTYMESGTNSVAHGEWLQTTIFHKCPHSLDEPSITSAFLPSCHLGERNICEEQSFAGDEKSVCARTSWWGSVPTLPDWLKIINVSYCKKASWIQCMQRVTHHGKMLEQAACNHEVSVTFLRPARNNPLVAFFPFHCWHSKRTLFINS